MGDRTREQTARRRAGVSLIEITIVVAVVSILTAIAIPNIAEWARNQRLKDSARSVGDLLLVARSEAIRTGRRQVVFFGLPGSTDPNGTPIEANGGWAPILVLDDGEPAGSDCQIDAGERINGLAPVEGVSWGASSSTGPVPTDAGNGPFAPSLWNGGTFADSGGSAVQWVLFGPDGLPVVFDGVGGDCGTIGAAGAGGGALYLTNGERDYAIVLSPIGGVRLHRWNIQASAWSD